MRDNYILLRIDPHIWNDRSLNYPEKIILNLVYGFTAQGRCCLVSDEWISQYFGIELKLVEDVIKMLAIREIINVTPGEAGHTRKISINIPGEPDPCAEGEYVEYSE